MTRKSRRVGWIAALALVAVAVGALGWTVGGDLLGRFRAGPEAVVSEEAAVAAEAKLARLRADGAPAELTEVELSSLLRFRGPQWAVSVVHEPVVTLAGDSLRLSGTVPTEPFAAEPEFAQVRAFLPDSARLEVVGRLEPLASGRAALEILQVELAGIPIPERYYADALRRIGRVDEPGLGPTAYPLRLPEGAESARVEGGQLILTP